MIQPANTSHEEPKERPQTNKLMNELVTEKPMSVPSPGASLWRWLTEPSEVQWLLPATGAWILGLDWLLFTQETVTLGLAVPLAAVVGFVSGAVGTFLFQSRYAGDRGPGLWLKSILAGIVVGIPVPLAGTFVGGWILFNSGLASIRDRMMRKK
jgi:hypothetical protein